MTRFAPSIGMFFLLLIPVLLFAIVPNRRVQSLPTPPAAYMPGSYLPPDTRCIHPVPSDTVAYCMIDGFSVQWDYKRGQITALYMTLVNVSIGDLIQQFGTPTGIANYGTSQLVYFGDKYAYVTVRGKFSPDSRVSHITYLSDAPTNVATWRGFSSYE